MLSQKAIAFLAVIALLAAPSYSFAEIVWEQAPDLSVEGGIIDQEFPIDGRNTYSTYLVNDVVFGTGVNIVSVTSYFTNLNGAWAANVTQGRLNIFTNDPLDNATDDPRNGQLVNVVVTATNGLRVNEVTASGLDIPLTAGRYWFGLSPISKIPQEFHYSSISRYGDETQFRNPGGGFGLGTDWGPARVLDPNFRDAAIRIESRVCCVPEPTTVGLLSLGLVGLVSQRRRLPGFSYGPKRALRSYGYPVFFGLLTAGVMIAAIQTTMPIPPKTDAPSRQAVPTIPHTRVIAMM